MKKVLVLMSTYNGQKYLKAQIESILNQQGVSVNILARDDVSTDETLEILKHYHETQSNFDYYSGRENLKSAKSFIELLIRCNKEYNYFAFADQDDVWDKDKLSIAVDKLSQYTDPAVYCSNARLVDKNLNSLNTLEYNYIPNFNFKRILIAGEIQGATMLMNHQLIKLFSNIEMPEYIPMHDYFVSLICAGIGGKIIFDKEPHIKYRQHDNNVLGVDYSLKGKIKRNLCRFTKKSNFLDLEIMCQELLAQQDFTLLPENITFLRLGAEYKKNLMSKVKFGMLKGVDFGKINLNIGYRLAVILGKL